MRTRLLCLLAFLAFACGAVAAGRGEQVARFIDGRYMVIQGHEISGTWVRLDLGGESWLLMPLDRVKSIQNRRHDRYVYREPSPRERRELWIASRRAAPANRVMEVATGVPATAAAAAAPTPRQLANRIWRSRLSWRPSLPPVR